MQENTEITFFRGDEIEISRIAYRLWGAAGRPSGRYMEFWPQAEQQFKEANALAEQVESLPDDVVISEANPA